MENNTEKTRKHPEPADSKRDAKASEAEEAKVPPASETWVEGQPTSDADYQERPPENS
jgi:hypothetical protein